mgnify:CR=1 FL=1
MLDMLRKAFGMWYVLDQELSLDENMIAYKGRAQNIHYNKSKHHRWGFMSNELTEAATGYLSDFWLACNEKVRIFLFLI